MKRKLKEKLQELKEKIELTTTIRSIVLLMLLFSSVVIIDYTVNICGLGFDYLRLISDSILLFLLFKFYLIFCSETNYSKKAVDIENRYSAIKNRKHLIQGKDMFLSVNECRTILMQECKQENNKHIKAIIREVGILLAITFLLSQKFTFGG